MALEADSVTEVRISSPPPPPLTGITGSAQRAYATESKGPPPCDTISFDSLCGCRPAGAAACRFCEATIVGSSLGDEYHCMTCDCRARVHVPLTALSSA